MGNTDHKVTLYSARADNDLLIGAREGAEGGNT